MTPQQHDGDENMATAQTANSTAKTARAPAPWTLSGCGYITAIRCDSDFLDEDCFLEPEQVPSRRGRIAYMMLVDYTDSPVGPYQELLFIPGRVATMSGAWRWTISRIFVSTEASVSNGRENWGIPKELADFDVHYDTTGRGCDEFQVARDGHTFARMSFRPWGFSMPVTTRILPASMCTLVQAWRGREFVFAPEASGRAGPAKMAECAIDPDVFPDLTRGTVLTCLQVPDFTMTFPVARIDECR